MTETRPGTRQQMDIARRQHKMLARAAATRIEHYAKQVLADLANDRPVSVHGQQVAIDMLALCTQLAALGAYDEITARLGGAAA